MDTWALKNLVDVRAKEPAPPLPGGPQNGPIEGTAYRPDALPGAGQARQSWQIYVPPYKELPGLFSARAFSEHMVLYQGYLSRAKMAEGAPPEERVRLHESYDVAGACLHELFFAGLAQLPPPPAPTVQNALLLRYGSLDTWWMEMVETGMVAKGWAITSVCSTSPEDIVVWPAKSHHHGLPPGYIPICVVDCYEHAYWMDHGTDKRRYLEAIKQYINWEALDERFIHATR